MSLVSEIFKRREKEWESLSELPEHLPARYEVLRQLYQELHALNSKLLLQGTAESKREAQESEQWQNRIQNLSSSSFVQSIDRNRKTTLCQCLKADPNSTVVDELINLDPYTERLAREDQKLERNLVVVGTRHCHPRWEIKLWTGKTQMRQFEATVLSARKRNFPGGILLWIDAPHPPDEDGNWAGNWVFLAHPGHAISAPNLPSSPS